LAAILTETRSLQEVSYVVLDEADRMLDLGFEPEIRHIVGCTRADRQTLMFSATWPPEIQRLAASFLSSPVHVTIGSQDLAASHSVEQTVEVVEEYNREARLAALLSKHHASRKNRIIIFVLYKKVRLQLEPCHFVQRRRPLMFHGAYRTTLDSCRSIAVCYQLVVGMCVDRTDGIQEAPRIEQFLQRKGFKAAAVHGDVAQQARNHAVAQFKSGEVPLLIATDVAARGLDIPDVEMVINFSFPLTVEDYVHRIGRTGRAGKTGCAHTFFVGKNDKAKAGELVNVLREANQVVPKELMAFGTSVKQKESKLYGAHFKTIDHTAKATKVKFDSDDE
jgi:ATP-dependent RNA helicase DBP3